MKHELRRSASTREGGFSAVELMIAMSLFGILMMGFLAVFPLGMRSVEKGERMTVAASLAQDQMEILKLQPRTHADLTAGAHTDAANPLMGVYSRSWVITNDTPIAGMMRVDMTVSFSDNGIARNTQMSTYITP